MLILEQVSKSNLLLEQEVGWENCWPRTMFSGVEHTFLVIFQRLQESVSAAEGSVKNRYHWVRLSGPAANQSPKGLYDVWFLFLYKIIQIK